MLIRPPRIDLILIAKGQLVYSVQSGRYDDVEHNNQLPSNKTSSGDVILSNQQTMVSRYICVTILMSMLSKTYC